LLLIWIHWSLSKSEAGPRIQASVTRHCPLVDGVWARDYRKGQGLYSVKELSRFLQIGVIFAQLGKSENFPFAYWGISSAPTAFHVWYYYW